MTFDGIDFSNTTVYDMATGALVAVVGVSNPGVFSCTAGPACFPLLKCDTPQMVDCGPADGGIDAELGEASGVDAVAD